MSVTIRDVAERSGVSIATVSRVINNTAEVAQKTRDRVEEAIRELGYEVPTPSVRTLQKALRTIGLLMSDINNVHFPAVIRGMERCLFQEDYSLLVCNTDEDTGIERRYIRTLIDKGVEGIAILGARLAEQRHDHIIELSNEIPVVMIDDYLVGTNIYSVMTDEVEGAYQAVKHLVNLGHTRIAYVHGDGGYTTSMYKREGYEKALRDGDLPVDTKNIVAIDPHEEGGYEAGRLLMSMDPSPTAIFTENDQLAMGIMRAIFKSGRRVPTDMSIVGFSDSPNAAHLFPALTSVNQFPIKTGELAAKTILKAIHREPMIQRRIILQPELSVRESTARVYE